MQDVIPKIICVVGARPNFVKIGPLLQALRCANRSVDVCLVHTGQHYDPALDSDFCASLNLPAANYHLGVGSGTHAVQTAQIMLKFEPVIEYEQPDAVLVVGDVNSTIACSLVAAKHNVPVIHVEAGLRSFDSSMPEEINRILTDHLSTLLFTTEPSANENLNREGIDPKKVHFVGNIMIDTLKHFVEAATLPQDTFKKYGVALKPQASYAMVTLHRPSNVDNKEKLQGLIQSFQQLQSTLPIIFPLHPRTERKLQEYGLMDALKACTLTCPPLNYLEMLGCMKHAKIVLTDSGGVQEETTMLRVPCITLRENTERPVTVTDGTNQLVGDQLHRLSDLVRSIIASSIPERFPKYWDGKTSERIASILIPWLYHSRESMV